MFLEFRLRPLPTSSNVLCTGFSFLQIRMLDLVLKSLPEDSKESQTARILLYKLFYDQTDQGLTQFLLNLIKMLDTHKQPKRFSPLIFMTRIFLLILFHFDILSLVTLIDQLIQDSVLQDSNVLELNTSV